MHLYARYSERNDETYRLLELLFCQTKTSYIWSVLNLNKIITRGEIHKNTIYDF